MTGVSSRLLFTTVEMREVLFASLVLFAGFVAFFLGLSTFDRSMSVLYVAFH